MTAWLRVNRQRDFVEIVFFCYYENYVQISTDMAVEVLTDEKTLFTILRETQFVPV